jgi:hypothetical protein
MSLAVATRGIICTEGGDGTGPGPDVPVPVCDPDPESVELGNLFVDADNLDVEEIEPAPGQELLPNRIEAEDILPTLNTYSLPINL